MLIGGVLFFVYYEFVEGLTDSFAELAGDWSGFKRFFERGYFETRYNHSRVKPARRIHSVQNALRVIQKNVFVHSVVNFQTIFLFLQPEVLFIA